MNAVVLFPAPFEYLAERAPSGLLHMSGPNRKTGHAQMRAKSDLQAIEVWLSEFQDSPETFRAYRKEIERFLNWLFLKEGIPFSAASREHILAYRQFLANPEPVEEWCAPRYVRRTDPAWRPFEGGLADESRDYAITVLGSLFGYLRDAGYLIGSPVMRKRRASGRAKRLESLARKSKKGPSQAAQRYVPAHLMTLVLDTLARLAEEASEGSWKREIERGLFVLRFMVNTGLRRAELASAKLSDFVTTKARKGEQLNMLNVVGKGARDRQVVLTPAALEAVHRYHGVYGIAEVGRTERPLLLSTSGRNLHALEESQVYRIVQDAFACAAEALQGDERLTEDERQGLLNVSPHWLRRTYATRCLERNVALRHLQTQLGHRSEATTLGYQFSEISERYAALVDGQF
jgi:site-specific recombinase XerD